MKLTPAKAGRNDGPQRQLKGRLRGIARELSIADEITALDVAPEYTLTMRDHTGKLFTLTVRRGD